MASLAARIVPFAPIVFLACCGHLQVIDRPDSKAGFAKAMNDSIGKLHYDTAIETWGPPSSQAVGEKVIAVSWKERHTGSAVVFKSDDSAVVVPTDSSQELLIVFDKETKRMKTWSYRSR